MPITRTQPVVGLHKPAGVVGWPAGLVGLVRACVCKVAGQLGGGVMQCMLMVNGRIDRLVQAQDFVAALAAAHGAGPELQRRC